MLTPSNVTLVLSVFARRYSNVHVRRAGVRLWPRQRLCSSTVKKPSYGYHVELASRLSSIEFMAALAFDWGWPAHADSHESLQPIPSLTRIPPRDVKDVATVEDRRIFLSTIIWMSDADAASLVPGRKMGLGPAVTGSLLRSHTKVEGRRLLNVLPVLRIDRRTDHGCVTFWT